jgi:hypothetical protein
MSEARPGIGFRSFDDSRANRVLQHVADDREEGLVGELHGEAPESILPDMTPLRRTTLRLMGVDRHPPVDETAQGVDVARFYDGVKVIVQYGERVDAHGNDFPGGAKGIDEALELGVAVKDVRALVAPVDDVVDGAAELAARSAWHCWQEPFDCRL